MRGLDAVPFASTAGCVRCRQTWCYDEVDGSGTCPACDLGPLVPMGPGAQDVGYVQHLRVRNALFERASELGLRADHLAVVCALVTFEWVTGQWVWPSLETIAGRAGMSKSTAQRRVGELEDRGLLVRLPRGYRADGGRLSSAYCLSPLWNALDERVRLAAAA